MVERTARTPSQQRQRGSRAQRSFPAEAQRTAARGARQTTGASGSAKQQTRRGGERTLLLLPPLRNERRRGEARCGAARVSADRSNLMPVSSPPGLLKIRRASRRQPTTPHHHAEDGAPSLARRRTRRQQRDHAPRSGKKIWAGRPHGIYLLVTHTLRKASCTDTNSERGS